MFAVPNYLKPAYDSNLVVIAGLTYGVRLVESFDAVQSLMLADVTRSAGATPQYDMSFAGCWLLLSLAVAAKLTGSLRSPAHRLLFDIRSAICTNSSPAGLSMKCII